MPTAPTLPGLIRDEIANRGFSQREAAEAIGVTQQTLSRWVNNLLIPSPDSIAPLARFLRTTQSEVKRLRGEMARGDDRAIVERLDGIETSLRMLAREVRRLAEREG